MKVTYSRSYYGSRVEADPPAKLVEAVMQNIPMLHPERTHTLWASDRHLEHLTFSRFPGNEGWVVVIEPDGGA